MLSLAFSILHTQAVDEDRLLAMFGKERHFVDDLEIQLGIQYDEYDEDEPVASITDLKAWVDRANAAFGGG